MRLLFFTFILSLISLSLFSQDNNNYEFEKRNSITIGILQGGGSLIGADFETLITNQFGVQFGIGFVGIGGGINYHFKPTIRSSFISLQYWHQGIGESFAQSLIGPNFVFRGKKWLTFQIGMGTPLDRGLAMPDDFEQPPVMLMYSIGTYIPL